MRGPRDFDCVLDIIRVTRNEACILWCKCYRFYFYYKNCPDNGYYLQSNTSCKLFVKGVTEREQASAGNIKVEIIGGGVATVFLITIIGIAIAVYIIKRRKGTFCGSVISVWTCKCCHRKKSDAIIKKPKPQTHIERRAAPSGDLYTVVNTTTFRDVNDEYVTVNVTIENTAFGVCMDDDLLARQPMHEMTDSQTPIIQSKPTAGTRNLSEISGADYMNDSEIQVNSSAGVYDVISRAVMPETYTGDSHAAVISEEEYNVLNFKSDRMGQKDKPVANLHSKDE